MALNQSVARVTAVPPLHW